MCQKKVRSDQCKPKTFLYSFELRAETFIIPVNAFNLRS